MENVDDEIHVIQQRPASRSDAFDVVRSPARLPHGLLNVFGQCADMHV
jgi:hypothetical protein